jgi:hypothetical protein
LPARPTDVRAKGRPIRRSVQEEESPIRGALGFQQRPLKRMPQESSPTSVELGTIGLPPEDRFVLTEAIRNRQRNPGGRRELPVGVRLPGLVSASAGATRGSSHQGDPVAVSWLSFARGTGGGAAATWRDIEVTTLASVRAVISPCRTGTEAAEARSGIDGPGFPSRGSFFPTDIPRRPSFGFGQEAANAGCPGRSAERCGCRVQKRLRKEPTKRSAA